MPFRDKDGILNASDCKLPAPAPYPGSFNRNNKEGTLLSRDDWKKSECEKWVMEMEKSEKYENTPFHQRNFCFRAWMLKKFTRISAKETKEMLLFVETQRGEENERDEQIETRNTEEHCMDMEEGLEEDNMEVEYTGSQDLFDSEDDDERHKEWNKEETIRKHLQRSDEDLVASESQLPDCVVRCRAYQDRKENYIQEICFTGELIFKQNYIKMIMDSLYCDAHLFTTHPGCK